MERIDLFDKYIFGELSSEEREEMERRLKTDDELASEVEVYKLCVSGIRKEAEQDNADFFQAMKGISPKGLAGAIGREVAPISREQLIEQLRGKLQASAEENETLSGMAALSANSTEDDELEIPTEVKKDAVQPQVQSPKKDNFRLITIIFIVVLLLSLVLSLFL